MQMKFTAVLLLCLSLKMRDWRCLQLFLRSLARPTLESWLLRSLALFHSWLPAAKDGLIEEVLFVALNGKGRKITISTPTTLLPVCL